MTNRQNEIGVAYLFFWLWRILISTAWNCWFLKCICKSWKTGIFRVNCNKNLNFRVNCNITWPKHGGFFHLLYRSFKFFCVIQHSLELYSRRKHKAQGSHVCVRKSVWICRKEWRALQRIRNGTSFQLILNCFCDQVWVMTVLPSSWKRKRECVYLMRSRVRCHVPAACYNWVKSEADDWYGKREICLWAFKYVLSTMGVSKESILLKICWSIPCLNPSWKVHTWIEICASLNHRKKTKADGSRLIPRKRTETLVLLSVPFSLMRFRRVMLFFQLLPLNVFASSLCVFLFLRQFFSTLYFWAFIFLFDVCSSHTITAFTIVY